MSPNAQPRHVTASQEEPGALLTVMLDLDETLIHSEIIPMASRACYPEHPNVFYLPCGASSLLRVVKRPYLAEFLLQTSKRFELVVFTAGEEKYATAVLNVIDPTRLIAHRLFRQHCRPEPLGDGTLYRKDLAVLNRTVERTVLVDNSLFSFEDCQLENGILISSFYHDQSDTALLGLSQLLNFLETVEDVRFWLQDFFMLRKRIHEGTMPFGT
jgi:RNA polymerase II subunit A small phosphatase-like protein